jgi:hypothetical protein
MIKIRQTTMDDIIAMIFLLMSIFCLSVGGYLIRDEIAVGMLWIGTGTFIVATFWNYKRLEDV